MKKKITNKVKGYDVFGHDILLNYNKKGPSHQTVIGGFVSIIIKLFFVVFVFIKIKAMWFREANAEAMSESVRIATDTDKNTIFYNQTQTTFYFMPKKRGERVEIYRKGDPNEQLREMSKYFKPYFAWQRNNWFNSEFKLEKIKAKMCEKSDFD